MESSKLPDTKFETMFVRMLKELCENFKSMEKDIETIKRTSQK